MVVAALGLAACGTNTRGGSTPTTASLAQPEATLATPSVPVSTVVAAFVAQLHATTTNSNAADHAEWDSTISPGDNCTLLLVLNTPGLLAQYASAGIETNRSGTVGVDVNGTAGYDQSACAVNAQQVVDTINP